MIWKYVSIFVIIGIVLSGAYFKGSIDKERTLTAEYTEAYKEKLEEYRDIERDLQARVEELDNKHFREMLDVQENVDTIISNVRTRTERLYVKAKCPRVPNTTDTTSMDDASTRAELDADTAERIIRLTERGDKAIVQLTACQEYVKEVQKPFKE